MRQGILFFFGFWGEINKALCQSQCIVSWHSKLGNRAIWVSWDTLCNMHDTLIKHALRLTLYPTASARPLGRLLRLGVSLGRLGCPHADGSAPPARLQLGLAPRHVRTKFMLRPLPLVYLLIEICVHTQSGSRLSQIPLSGQSQCIVSWRSTKTIS